MATRRIRITTQPSEGEPEEVTRDFTDSPCVKIEDAVGGLLDFTSISAWEWAFDQGYSLADKGPFTMVEIDPVTHMPKGPVHWSYNRLTKEMKVCT